MELHLHEEAACHRADLTLKDFKSGVEPIWCPGCGDFGVLQALQRALAANGRPPHEVALVSGIGCSSRLPAYTSAYGFHGERVERSEDFPAAFARARASASGALLALAIDVESLTPRQTLSAMREAAEKG